MLKFRPSLGRSLSVLYIRIASQQNQGVTVLKLVGAIIAGCQQYENREFECRTRPCVTLAHRLKAPKSESTKNLRIHSRTDNIFLMNVHH